jgi:Alginate lyase
MRHAQVLVLSLVSIGTAQADGSRLNWCGLDTATAKTAPPELKRVLELAQTAVTADLSPVDALHFEHTLPTDPAYQASRRAVDSLQQLRYLAVCARVADAALAAKCAGVAKPAIVAWAKRYKPSGNPINENRLIPLIEAIDLVAPLLSADDRHVAEHLVRELATSGDAFFHPLKPSDGRLANNWTSWRLAIRAIAATTIGDDKLARETAGYFLQHAAHNIKPDGSTIDFVERDALLYHLYDIEAYVTAAAFAPATLSPSTRDALRHAIELVHPYFDGSKQHVEFVHTTVVFDVERRKAAVADYQNVPWKPEAARPLLRLARPLFPEIRAWTEKVVDPNYEPFLKLFVARCEAK